MADAKVARRRLLMESIFEMWDNEGCGFLELDDINGSLERFDSSNNSEVIRQGMYSRYYS